MRDHGHLIDHVDRRILTLLQEDGRMSNLALAQSVRLSPTAVLERVRRLVREGYILGYEARLNPVRLDARLLVFVEVLLDHGSPEVVERFRVAVAEHPEIMECHMVTGSFDYLLKVRVADIETCREFIAGVLQAIPGLRETRTLPVMEEVKNSARLRVA